MRPYWWWMYAALGAGLVLLHCLLPVAGTASRAAFVLVSATAAGAVLLALAGHRPAARRGWVLVAGGLWLWTLGDLAWLVGWSDVVLRRDPVLGIADVPYLAGYLLLAAAFSRPPGRRRDVGAILDSAILTIGFGLLIWVLFVHPVVGSNGRFDPETAMGFTYPLLDTVLLVRLLRYVPARGPRRAARRLALAALALLLVADVSFQVAAARGELLGVAPVVTGGWLLATVLLAAAGLHPVARTVEAPEPIPGPQVTRPMTAVRLMWLGSAVLLPPMVLAIKYWFGESLDDIRVSLVIALTVVVLVFARLITIVRELARTTGHLVTTVRSDSLTGLPNRRSFLETLDAHIGTSEDTFVSVLLIDIDRFKGVNDALGTQVGDAVLRGVAERLSTAFQGEQMVARLGRDEFALLVPGETSTESCLQTAAAVHELFEEPFDLDGVMLGIEARVGAAVAPRDGTTADLVLRHAEMANAAAKDRQERVLVYSPDLDTSDAERLVLLSELRKALDDGELVLHFQPQVELSTGRVTGVEALVRWLHPARGLLPPGDFLPYAEQTAHIRHLTRYVLDSALAHCRGWHDAGLDLKVAVNLSTRNLLDPAVVSDVREALERYDLPPSVLDLEITESSAMADPVRALDILVELRALGVSLSIDDYGTGYSSLSYLQQLPVARIKLDRSFVTTMRGDQGNAAIVRSTIELARHLSLAVIAEGVEDHETLRQLRALNCYAAQGFGLSRPVPGREVPQIVAELDTRLGADLELELLAAGSGPAGAVIPTPRGNEPPRRDGAAD